MSPQRRNTLQVQPLWEGSESQGAGWAFMTWRQGRRLLGFSHVALPPHPGEGRGRPVAEQDKHILTARNRFPLTVAAWGSWPLTLCSL